MRQTKRTQTRVTKYKETSVTVPKIIEHLKKQGIINDLDAVYVTNEVIKENQI